MSTDNSDQGSHSPSTTPEPELSPHPEHLFDDSSESEEEETDNNFVHSLPPANIYNPYYQDLTQQVLEEFVFFNQPIAVGYHFFQSWNTWFVIQRLDTPVDNTVALFHIAYVNYPSECCAYTIDLDVDKENNPPNNNGQQRHSFGSTPQSFEATLSL
jgi:hypothetical protein